MSHQRSNSSAPASEFASLSLQNDGMPAVTRSQAQTRPQVPYTRVSSASYTPSMQTRVRSIPGQGVIEGGRYRVISQSSSRQASRQVDEDDDDSSDDSDGDDEARRRALIGRKAWYQLLVFAPQAIESCAPHVTVSPQSHHFAERKEFLRLLGAITTLSSQRSDARALLMDQSELSYDRPQWSSIILQRVQRRQRQIFAAFDNGTDVVDTANAIRNWLLLVQFVTADSLLRYMQPRTKSEYVDVIIDALDSVIERNEDIRSRGPSYASSAIQQYNLYLNLVSPRSRNGHTEAVFSLQDLARLLRAIQPTRDQADRIGRAYAVVHHRANAGNGSRQPASSEFYDSLASIVRATERYR